MELADVAAIVLVAVGVVPGPVEDPEHVHAVFIAVAVVGLVVVPVAVAEWLVGAHPAPVALPLPVRQPRPEVTVTRVCTPHTHHEQSSG